MEVSKIYLLQVREVAKTSEVVYTLRTITIIIIFLSSVNNSLPE